MKDIQRAYSDPFDGMFDEAKTVLQRILDRPYSGSLRGALHAGNTAVHAINLLSGEHEIDNISYRVTTTNTDKQ
jgi:hypothetical protein